MSTERDEREPILPPPGTLEQMVARGLAEVLALEAMQRVLDDQGARDHWHAENDVNPATPRRRRDSTIIDVVVADDAPTLPFIRLAQDA